MKSVLICLGDSLTAGEGVGSEKTFPALLAARYPTLHVLNQGRSGWSTGSYLRRWPEVAASLSELVPKEKEGWILIQLGANDLRERGHRLETITECRANLITLISRLHKLLPSLEAVLVAPPTMFPIALSPRMREAGFSEKSPELLRRLRDSYQALAKHQNWHFIDLYYTLSLGNTLDGAHPTPAGLRELAEAISQQLLVTR